MKTQLPKFGLLTNPSKEITKEIRSIKRLGFDFVELGIEGPEGKPEIILKKKNKILNLLKKFKTKSNIGHTSYWIDLGSDYEPIRRGWIEECKKIIKVANELNLSLINFHTGFKGHYYDGKSKRIILKNWIKSLNELSRYANRYGIFIIVENVPRGSGLSSANDIKYIINRVRGIMLHLDIPHAFTDGGMKEVMDYIKVFRNKIAHIHWHDNHGRYDEHLPIGKGTINHKKIVQKLKKINYNRTITLEVFTSKKDAQISMIKLKKLWKKV